MFRLLGSLNTAFNAKRGLVAWEFEHLEQDWSVVPN